MGCQPSPRCARGYRVFLSGRFLLTTLNEIFAPILRFVALIFRLGWALRRRLTAHHPAATSSAPPTPTYGAAAAVLSVVCSWYEFYGSMVGLWCPGLGAANAGALKPVGWGSIVKSKKEKKKRPLYNRHGESCRRRGQRAMRAGQRAARREVLRHKPSRGLRIIQQDFKFPWTRLFKKAGSTPRATTTGFQNFTFSVEAISADPPVVQLLL